MEVYAIDISSWTAGFRYPNLISGYQPTLEVPPLSTVLGLINAAAGSYQKYKHLKIGYYFSYEAKAMDRETIYQVEANKKGEPTNNAKSNVMDREFLFDNFLRLYVTDEKIANYFRQPFFPLVLGRSNDLATVLRIKKLGQESFIPKREASCLSGQIVPFNGNLLAGKIQALPKYFTNSLPRKNIGTEPYSVINHQAKVSSRTAAFHDPTLKKGGVDIYMHELNFTEEEYV